MFKNLIVFLILSVVSLGSIYPIVNNDRSLWLSRVDNIVFINHPYTLGLTKTDFNPVVDVSFNNHGCDIDLSNLILYNGLCIDLTDNVLSVSGTYNSVGNIVSGIKISGNGYLEYYNEDVFMGYIMPEPISFMIFITGVWFLVQGKS